MPYQLNSSKLFLTYSQSGVTTQELYDFLEAKFNPEEILVAQELHETGDIHHHAYLSLKEPVRTRDCRFADYTRSDGSILHGKYEGCRSPKNVVKYCTKEEYYRANFDVSAFIGKRKSAAEILGQRILDGEDLLEIVQALPQHLKGYKSLKADIEEFKEDRRRRDSPLDLPDEIPNPWGKRFFVDTDRKKCHFWFYSSGPNKGKTLGVVLPLVRHHGAALIKPKSTYHTIKQDTKVVVFDEFSQGQMKAESLNCICDGLYRFRVFMRGEIILDDKPVVVVCSNYSILEVFPYRNELVYARFNEYNVSEYDFV